GLPLVFNDELTTWLDGGPDATAKRVPGQPTADFDSLVAEAQRLHPLHRVTRLRIHEAHGNVLVDMSPQPGAMVPAEKRVSHWIAFDRWSGVRRWPAAQDVSTLGGHTAGARFMTLMLRLHIDFFAGLWGQL